MKCMLLSAGLGKRLRPLTCHTPKPLIKLAGKSLIEHHLEKLKSAGYEKIVINLSYLGDMIQQKLGDGLRYGVHIEYSHEGEHPLGTAGGIIHALPLLGSKPFLVMNSDIWCDHSLSFPDLAHDMAHLVLVDNPAHHPDGDFVYESGKVYNTGKSYLTFSGIGVYLPKLFENRSAGKPALAHVLRTAINQGQVSAEYHAGKWFDIGSPERLEQAEDYLSEVVGSP